MRGVEQLEVRVGLAGWGALVELVVVVWVGDRLGVPDVPLDAVVHVFIQRAVQWHHFRRVSSWAACEGSRGLDLAVLCFAVHLRVQSLPWDQPAPQVVTGWVRHPLDGVLVGQLDQGVVVDQP